MVMLVMLVMLVMMMALLLMMMLMMIEEEESHTQLQPAAQPSAVNMSVARDVTTSRLRACRACFARSAQVPADKAMLMGFDFAFSADLKPVRLSTQRVVGTMAAGGMLSYFGRRVCACVCVGGVVVVVVVVWGWAGADGDQHRATADLPGPPDKDKHRVERHDTVSAC